jgi:long-chain acyl-CoA synthetase
LPPASPTYGFRNGDLARRDDDGYVYITGRKKDIIIKGGVNIASLEHCRDKLTAFKVPAAVVIVVPKNANGKPCHRVVPGVP